MKIEKINNPISKNAETLAVVHTHTHTHTHTHISIRK